MSRPSGPPPPPHHHHGHHPPPTPFPHPISAPWFVLLSPLALLTVLAAAVTWRNVACFVCVSAAPVCAFFRQPLLGSRMPDTYPDYTAMKVALSPGSSVLPTSPRGAGAGAGDVTSPGFNSLLLRASPLGGIAPPLFSDAPLSGSGAGSSAGAPPPVPAPAPSAPSGAPAVPLTLDAPRVQVEAVPVDLPSPPGALPGVVGTHDTTAGPVPTVVEAQAASTPTGAAPAILVPSGEEGVSGGDDSIAATAQLSDVKF
jgi:hypothetical protein